MTRIRTLFLVLTVVGPLHMTEQMLTSIDEFHAIRALFAHYYGWFDPSASDLASVLLITIVWTVVSLIFLALLWDRTPRLIVVGLFGLFGAAEVHRVLQTLVKGAYDAGVITSVPYAVAGCLLVSAVARELRRPRPLVSTEAALA